MRIVALEEHFSLPELAGRIDKQIIASHGYPQDQDAMPTIKKAQSLLPETGETRLKLMNESGISLQVLSVSGPGAEMLPPAASRKLAADYNNVLAARTAAHPDRFAAFAHLPMTDGEAAAEELERAVRELHFCGAMINGMTDNLFLDDTRFAPILAKAEALDVPLYLHPAFPPPAIQQLYYKRLSPTVSAALSSAAFGWHAEVAIHVLRLAASGTLDRYPKLQLIIGHMGEMLPAMMYRAEMVMSREVTKSDRTISEILRSQVSITTSGVFTEAPFRNAVATFGIDRILFSVDYPYSENAQGKQFLDSLHLSAEDLEKVACGNADRLLGLRR